MFENYLGLYGQAQARGLAAEAFRGMNSGNQTRKDPFVFLEEKRNRINADILEKQDELKELEQVEQMLVENPTVSSIIKGLVKIGFM